MLGLCVSSPWPPEGRQELEGWGHKDWMYISYMVLDRSAWMPFLLSVPCTGDLLPYQQKISEPCRKHLSDTKLSVVISLTLKHTKAATKSSSSGWSGTIKGTPSPTQLPSNNLRSVLKWQLSLRKVGHSFNVKFKTDRPELCSLTLVILAARQFLLLS